MTRKKMLREKKKLKKDLRRIKKFVTVHHFDIEPYELIDLTVKDIIYQRTIIKIDLKINRLKNRRKKLWRKAKWN